MITDVVIMAGGVGERLWPASTPMHPKQFFKLNDDLTFLQSSLLRALALDVEGKIVIITRRELVAECTRQCNELCSHVNSRFARNKIQHNVVVIGELCMRHTLAALLTSVVYLQLSSKKEEHTIITFSCDHVMENTVAFLKDCEIAADAAESNNLVCFGIKPSFPCTDFGYIKMEKDPANRELINKGHAVNRDGKNTQENRFSENASRIHKIRRFVQKPDLEHASEFIKDPCYLWNSGMLCFTGSFLLQQAKRHASRTYTSFMELKKTGKSPSTAFVNGIPSIIKWNDLDAFYEKLPNLDVDKVISEKTRNAFVVKADFQWADIGSWDSLSSKCTLKQEAKVVSAESKNNMVYSDIPVVLCGVEDLIIVQKEGKLLIMKKESSSLLKGAVEEFNGIIPD